MTSESTSLRLFPDEWSQRARAALQQLAGTSPVQRLIARDLSLWSRDPAEQRIIANRLGWLSMPAVMEARVPEIQAVAEAIRADGFTHALLLGMGGSSLFAEVCRFTFGIAPGWLDLSILDSTDPLAITRMQQRLPLERTLFLVSSKSGTTTESAALCDYFYEHLRHVAGERAGRHFLAITDAGTALESQAATLGFRHVFAHGPQTGQDVGGRFSAMTYFGLVPAALMGVDIRRLLREARAMLERCGPGAALPDNSAAQLAALLFEAMKAGRDKVTIVSSGRLSRFGSWAEQLVAESTGKSGHGLVPIDAEPIRPASAYPPDRVFVELQLETELDAELERRVQSCADAGHPVARIRWQDPSMLAGEAMRWFLVTSLAASWMQINPFDEPNVQESKDRTRGLLERYSKERALPAEEPLLIEQDLAIYGAVGSVRGTAVSEALRAFVQHVRPGDYLVVASFLPRTPAMDEAVASLRGALGEATRAATMLGFGPRYLHSTGQLHKGGPDRVVLIFLTAEDLLDVAVPGRPYSFSVLKQAQALGDYLALRERKRRVIRLHLGRSPLEALRQIERLLSQPADAAR